MTRRQQIMLQLGRDMWLGGWHRGEVARSTLDLRDADWRVMGWDECQLNLEFAGVVGNLGNVGNLDAKR